MQNNWSVFACSCERSFIEDFIDWRQTARKWLQSIFWTISTFFITSSFTISALDAVVHFSLPWTIKRLEHGFFNYRRRRTGKHLFESYPQFRLIFLIKNIRSWVRTRPGHKVIKVGQDLLKRKVINKLDILYFHWLQSRDTFNNLCRFLIHTYKQKEGDQMSFFPSFLHNCY
jgi:hypothetical protein